MAGNGTIRLTLPRQDLPHFTLFRPDAGAAADWLRTLPVTRAETCAQMLAHALAEMNRARLPPEARHSVLEALRPSIDTALANLGKRFINQPLVMPDKPRQLADLCDQLLSLAGTAYAVVAVETIEQRDAIRQTHPARLACQALQHALLYTGRKILQSFQLYRPLHIRGWHSLHQLFALAENQQLADLPVPEPLAGGETIRATYFQALLLGCCKPNQLRQADMATLFTALRNWADKVELVAPGAGTGLFLVDLDSDQPPRYSSLYPGEPGPGCRYINTALAIEELYRRKAPPGGDNAQDAAAGIPDHLVDHLISSLGSMSLRNFKRAPSTAPLRVCLGLSATHYHVAGRRDFRALLRNSGFESAVADPGNPFLQEQRRGDAWSTANPHNEFVRNEWLPGQESEADRAHRIELDERTRAQLLEEVDVQLPLDQRYPVHEVGLADASPGGYCLEWTESLPGDVNTGDLVGLKEGQSEQWVIAVIRWISRLENSRTLIGLELLSPRASAYGAVIHRPGADSSAPMRALLLPEIRLVAQQNTLVTPRASFRERQRVTLVADGETHTVLLLRQVSCTASFAQFEFRYIEELGDVLAREHGASPGGGYDSLWSNI
ncbi:MAG: hypothetical protein CME59_02830 [Halioglobus sp.]|nr:hypothetical protein [Halioglobus sp.]